jgi:signal transduction histidine kinase
MTIAVVLLILSLVIAIGWLWMSIARLREKNKLISEQAKEIERQFFELKEKGDELSNLVYQNQQIISVVSHDLKGPFNRIFALIQLLNFEAANFTKDQREYLDKIHQIVADGLAMMRNLLDNRRLEERGIDLLKEKVNITNLLTSLVKNYQVLASKKSVTIHFDCAPALVLQSDKGYLIRIFENLLSNALKFSEAEKNIFVTAFETDSWILVSIKDEGPGISQDDQSKMFQKFQRLSARPTAGESSTGLGLWIVKTILKKMNGEIMCESALREGSTFTVRLSKS